MPTYLDEEKRQLRGHKRLGESAMSQLNDEQFFTAIDRKSNSVAIIVKHILGNAHSRFSDFLISDGEKPDRLCDREFEIDSSATRNDIMETIGKRVRRSFRNDRLAQPADAERIVTIRQEPHTVIRVLNRALSLTTLNTLAEFVFLAKHLRSSQWQTLSIPRGKSEEYKVALPACGTYKTTKKSAPQPVLPFAVGAANHNRLVLAVKRRSATVQV